MFFKLYHDSSLSCFSAAKLGLSMTGYNTTDFDRKVVRIFSPKLMSVVPESEEARKNEVRIKSS